MTKALTNDGLCQQEKETTMNTLFAQDIYIRLTEDNSAFLCTIKRGRFYSKTTEVALNCQLVPEPVGEKALVPLKRRSSHWPTEER
jgi:hypothetical protein